MILSLVVMFLFGWRLALMDLAFIPPLLAMGGIQTQMLVGFARGSKAATEEGGKVDLVYCFINFFANKSP